MKRRQLATHFGLVLLVVAAASQAAALAPRRAGRALDRAERLARSGRTARAVEAVRELLETHPDLIDAHLLYIGLRSRSARAIVRREYERKLRESPQSGLLHFLVGHVTPETGKRLAHYRKAAALDPKLFRAQLELGRLCRTEAVDDVAAALRALEAAVALEPESAEARLELARSLEVAGRPADAVAALRRATGLDPRNEDAWLHLARLLRHAGPREAGQALQRAVGACPRGGRLCWALADLRWAERQYRAAERPLEKALRYGEDAGYAAEARARLAAWHLMNGHERRARRVGASGWAEAIAEMADGRLTAEAFGAFYEGQQAEGEHRIGPLERAARLAPRSAVVVRALGAACFGARRFAQAADACARLLALRPDDIEARQRCAAAHLLAGNARAAVDALTKGDSPLPMAKGDSPLSMTKGDSPLSRGGLSPSLPREAGWLLADAEAVAAGKLQGEAFAARHAARGDQCLAAVPGRSSPGRASRGTPGPWDLVIQDRGVAYRGRLRACIEKWPAYLTPRVELAYRLREAGLDTEAGVVLEAASEVAGPAAVDADRHALLGGLALDAAYFAKAIAHYRKAVARCPGTARHHGALARAYVERGEFGPAREALERQLQLDPAGYDVADSMASGDGAGDVLEARLEPGDVLRYRYTTDGGQPGREAAGVEFRYVIDAVQPGGLVEATLEVARASGREVEGGRGFVGARVAVTCSNVFGLVDVGEPAGGVPGEFAQLAWLVQFIHGPSLPVRRWPGQRWREPGWTELGRLYGGVVHFERVRRGTARLTKAIAYEKPAEASAAEFEVMAVRGRAAVAFDLKRRVLERAEITTHISMRSRDGSEAALPPSQHRLELLGVERGARQAGQRHLIAGVPYIRQAGPKCAAAALAMVFRSFGRQVDQEQLFKQLKGRTGGVHSHMLPTAARAHGFDAHPCIGSLAGLRDTLRAGVPVVLFLNPMGMGHAVVAIGFDDGRREIILHDPATAPFKRVAYGKLDREWRESDRSCIVLVPKGEAKFARLRYPREDAVEAMFEGDRAFAARRARKAEQAYRRALTLFPGYAEARLSLARILVAQRRLPDARAETEKLIAERPDCLAARIAKADILVLERKYAEAITLALNVEAEDRQNLRNLNVLASAYVHSNQRDKAVATLERAVRYAPAWVNVRFRLAALYFLSGRYDSAARQYRASIEHEPRNTQALYLLAATLHQSLRDDRRRELPWAVRRKHAADAIDALNTLRAIEGPSCETSAELAHLYDFLGNGPRNIALLKRSVQEMTLRQLRQQDDTPSDADPFSFLGSVSTALRKAAAGLATFARAQRERSTNLNNLAWAYAIRGQNLQEAHRLATQSVGLRAAGFNLDTLAWIDYQLGNLDAARTHFLEAIALEPDPVAHIHLALTCQKLGRHKEADEHLAKAAELALPAGQVHLELAEACAQVGLHDRKLAALEAAVAADPRHRLARYRLAVALLEKGQDLQRIASVADALHAADPADPLYAGLLGAACQLQGRTRKARSLLERAVAPDPLLGRGPVGRYRYFLGLNLLARGDRGRAVGELKQYVEATPNGAFAPKAIALIRR